MKRERLERAVVKEFVSAYNKETCRFHSCIVELREAETLTDFYLPISDFSRFFSIQYIEGGYARAPLFLLLMNLKRLVRAARPKTNICSTFVVPRPRPVLTGYCSVGTA